LTLEGQLLVDFQLANEIDVDQSSKNVVGKKIELKLFKKTSGMNWMVLEKG